jgi:hypothetical protein
MLLYNHDRIPTLYIPGLATQQLGFLRKQSRAERSNTNDLSSPTSPLYTVLVQKFWLPSPNTKSTLRNTSPSTPHNNAAPSSIRHRT